MRQFEVREVWSSRSRQVFVAAIDSMWELSYNLCYMLETNVAEEGSYIEDSKCHSIPFML